ncbi:glycosyltransferase family 8 protein [Myriangium duriaei CBS 260.36]|uniref:Glycosyltransferase family 8 protein n=1 Tax=Myriangium duriaei CBS 260.36 TaxID=1168546 RepID=A0A9P4J075_9PEZI|nr:glycosyltransferase family 8 protein [Myriangium duriaei CBS 260.36]
MRKLLLSSSQVSVLLSCFIALAFTSLLFCTGVLLQHRTVSSLRGSLSPSIPQILSSHPSPPSRISPRSQSSSLDPPSPPTEVTWSRLSHTSYITQHSELCSTLLLFSHLHALRSPARRVLYFPTSWAADLSAQLLHGQHIDDPYLALTHKLLRLAARRYHVELRPVDGDRPLATLLGQEDVDRTLVVRTPGWPLDVAGLDRVLGYASMEEGKVGLARRQGTGEVDALLLSSASAVDEVLRSVPTGGKEKGVLDGEELSWLSGHAAARVVELANLTQSIGALHGVVKGEKFNQTEFLKDGRAWLTFTDEKLPAGPEVEVPFDMKVKARPKNKDAEWLWTSLYGDYAEKRREVCGLGLEGWYT